MLGRRNAHSVSALTHFELDLLESPDPARLVEASKPPYAHQAWSN